MESLVSLLSLTVLLFTSIDPAYISAIALVSICSKSAIFYFNSSMVEFGSIKIRP